MSSHKYKSMDMNQKASRKTCCCGLKPWQICCLVFGGIMTFIASGVGITVAVYSSKAPLHAQCSVSWSLNESCDKINGLLVTQINTMTGPKGCENGGEKCLYTFLSGDKLEIKAIHETPVKHYKDDLSFKFTENADGKSCEIKGYSTSETWYAVLDQGTNYCNLHNLILGAGIDKLPGFKESTSNSICTQYSSADCEKY